MICKNLKYMKNSLITTLLKRPFVYNIYYYAGTFFCNFLKLFIRPNDKLILFMSFGGRYYSGGPRVMYEAMKEDPRFSGHELVWGFVSPDEYPDIPCKVKTNSLAYIVTALKARCWIGNTSMTRALNFKGKRTYYFYTTHGPLPKLCGQDLRKSKTFVAKGSPSIDLVCSQSEYVKNIVSSWKTFSKCEFLICGVPQNDRIANCTSQQRINIRHKLNIPDDKTVVLYAPTFRETQTYEFQAQVDFNKWENILGEDYLLLYRAHPCVANLTKIPKNSKFVRDVSSYPDNAELLIAADALISDYSGIFFEFGVQDKPMFCYAYDYDEYEQTRGLYFDVREVFPGGFMNEDELLSYIRYGNKNEIMAKVNEIKTKFIVPNHNATEICVDKIYNKIGI